MLTVCLYSGHTQGSLSKEYCILKGRVKNDRYKFLEVFIYESLYAKKDTIAINQAGYFEKKIFFSGERDIEFRYGNDNCNIYIKSNSINLEWDGLDFSSTISVVNKADFINDFLVKYYKKFKLETKAPLDPNYFNISGVNNLDIKETTTSFLFRGNINAIMKKLADIELANLWIEEPDLEEIFMHYYEKEA